MTPVSLRRQIEQEYDPAQESREDWQSRVLRGVAQLERFGQALTEDESEKLVWKARYAEDVHGMDLSVQVSSLKKLFGDVLLYEDKYTEGEYNGRLSALMEMLRARGTEMSASVNRMFSSVGTGMPSSLGASPEQARGQLAGSQQAGGPARVPLAFTPPRKAEVDMLRDEVQTLRAQLTGSPGGTETENTLAKATSLQTEAIAAALRTKEQKHSVVKITPTFRWPLLGDDGPDANEVEDFYEKYEDLCRLANDGRGMNATEHLTTLLSCLRGSEDLQERE